MNTVLRALGILLASSVVSILASIVRQKVIALEVGPAGIGQLGLLLSLSGALATIGGLGLATSGVQRISVTEKTTEAATAQRGLLTMTTILALLTGGFAVMFAPLLGLPLEGLDRWVVGSSVALMIASAGQSALLNGLGLLSKIAWLGGLSAVVGTTLTVTLLFLEPRWGLYAAVFTPALVTYCIGWWFRRRAGVWQDSVPWSTMWPQLRPMLSLGIVFAAGTGIAALGQYGARWYVLREYGEVSLGQYQAAWSVTMLYLGVLLSAMSVEYFPRVSRVVGQGDLEELNRIVGRQILLVVGLALPVICLFVLFSQQIITLLYTSKFAPAALLAQRQFVGDIFKLAAWPMSYALLARSVKFPLFLAELIWVLAYLVLLIALHDISGFSGLGWSYTGAYIVYLAFISFIYKKSVGGSLLKKEGFMVLLAVVVVVFHSLISQHRIASLITGGIDVIVSGVVVIFYLKSNRKIKH